MKDEQAARAGKACDGQADLAKVLAAVWAEREHYRALAESSNEAHHKTIRRYLTACSTIHRLERQIAKRNRRCGRLVARLRDLLGKPRPPEAGEPGAVTAPARPEAHPAASPKAEQGTAAEPPVETWEWSGDATWRGGDAEWRPAGTEAEAIERAWGAAGVGKDAAPALVRHVRGGESRYLWVDADGCRGEWRESIRGALHHWSTRKRGEEK